MDEHIVIDQHLYDRPPANGIKYISSLMALLNDTRAQAERDDNGQLLSGKRGQSWLAATGYLVLLDQVGTSFQVKGKKGFGDHPIIWAVHSFSSAQDVPTLDALYALRCALAHDYSLINPNTNMPSRRHLFNLIADATTPLITFPKTPWSGTYDLTNPPTADEITLVNLQKVGDLAEEVVAKLRELHANKELEIRPPMTVDQFHLRYGLVYQV